MRRNELLNQRNTAIYNDFERMFNTDGKRCEIIYSELSAKYYLGAETISKIVMSVAKKTPSKNHLNNV